MMTTTKFTNNVLRAKAVKNLNIKSGSNTGKFSNKVIRAGVPSKTNSGQSSGGGKAHTIGGVGGNSYGGQKSPAQTPKGAGN